MKRILKLELRSMSNFLTAVKQCLILFIAFNITPAKASLSCEAIFSQPSKEQIRIAIRQWHIWELLKTVPGWSQTAKISPMNVAKVSLSTVNINKIDSLSDAQLGHILKINTQANTIDWFQHPHNQDKHVPNYNLPADRVEMAYHTASRTVMSSIDGKRYSIKMPTDYPFGPKGEEQPTKTLLHKDLVYAVAWSNHVKKIDEAIGHSAQLKVQKDILAVIDKNTKNGFIIREMETLEDGYLYLPAHQLPNIGKQIADNNNVKFSKYWGEFWAKAIGRFQAQILYRYGMEAHVINPQNFLIQLDHNLNPTGVIVWRDFAESHKLERITQIISDINPEVKNIESVWGDSPDLAIDNMNLDWHFNDVNYVLSHQEKKAWQTLHDNAYREELQKALNYKLPKTIDLRDTLSEEVSNSESLLVKKIQLWHQKQRASK